MSKKSVMKYCNQCWPLYKLEGGEKWPENGSLNYDTVLELMPFLQREGKQDEVFYADMFFTLWEHPEWQKEWDKHSTQGSVCINSRKRIKSTEWGNRSGVVHCAL